MAVGGGSGGHVTPVVAVLRELDKRAPDSEIRFWCDRKFAPQARKIVGHYRDDIPVHVILAGKFRRYAHVPMWRQLFWPSVLLPNIRDLVFIAAGFVQSFFKLIMWRPDVVFTKGGYVCLPVGIAAKLLRIPLVIHDSDAHPGLTNRVLAKWADAIATGAPLEHYNYPAAISRYVGIPISDAFTPFSSASKRRAKKEWDLAVDRPLLVVTGGGLGARRINDTIAKALSELGELCSVVLISGTDQYQELKKLFPANDNNIQLHAFVPQGLSSLLGAAEVVVARAGATTILELAALEKPTILVPNARLTGGHQVKNATVYSRADAVILLDEDDMYNNPEVLVEAINNILSRPQEAKAMGRRFAEFARPHAASDMAEMIIGVATSD